MPRAEGCAGDQPAALAHRPRIVRLIRYLNSTIRLDLTMLSPGFDHLLTLARRVARRTGNMDADTRIPRRCPRTRQTVPLPLPFHRGTVARFSAATVGLSMGQRGPRPVRACRQGSTSRMCKVAPPACTASSAFQSVFKTVQNMDQAVFATPNIHKTPTGPMLAGHCIDIST